MQKDLNEHVPRAVWSAIADWCGLPGTSNPRRILQAIGFEWTDSECVSRVPSWTPACRAVSETGTFPKAAGTSENSPPTSPMSLPTLTPPQDLGLTPLNPRCALRADADAKHLKTPSPSPSPLPLAQRIAAQRREDPLFTTDQIAHPVPPPASSARPPLSTGVAAPSRPAADAALPSAVPLGSTGEEVHSVPNYNDMTPAELTSLLDEYGLKTGSKPYMVKKLLEIWEQLHTAPPVHVAPPRAPASKTSRGVRAAAPSQQASGHSQQASGHPLPPPPHLLPALSSCLSESAPGGYGAAGITIKEMERSLAAFIKGKSEIYEKMLLMESVDADDLLSLAQAGGVKCTRPRLLAYLESQGVCHTQKRQKREHNGPRRAYYR
ncbi:hypothetical protein CYMTET_15992 [Cymbomonas tetramitiformis]|uniref:Structure-specific endonuclease subunit SLX4 n=1 Tax=Cymbomonas tetramitiformis TaxID=36881 RepID=A0AAE0L8D3_9CHLO|nr:hypothetical protein CYMTET_15992 [Cymbomonas tetramitiformis]